MTVSRVVNQSAPVDEDTRNNVEEAIRKLRYRPNVLAQKLRRQHASQRTLSRSAYAIYEHYRECAQTKKHYPGLPGKARRLGFAKISGDQPFGVELEQNLREQAALAGFAEQNLIVVDNQYDPEVGLFNAEQMLAQHPDIFIE